MQTTTSKTGANSYIDDKSFCHYNIDYLIKTIITSVDRIKITNIKTDIDTLHNMLADRFKMLSDEKPINNNYRRVRTYCNEAGDIFTVVYGERHLDYHPHLIIDLYQPTLKFILEVESVFWDLYLFPLVSEIELAWDFYTDHIWQLKEFLEQHIHHIYHRGKSFTFNDKDSGTFYTSGNRKAVKRVKIYTRPKETAIKDFVRMELVLCRPLIKQLGINLPFHPSMLDLDFTRFFQFKRLNSKKMTEAMIKREMPRIRKMVIPIWKRDKLQPLRQHPDQLYISQIESHSRSLGHEKLMVAVERLRNKRYGYGISNYSRFLEPMDDWNLLIKEVALEQGFNL